MCGIVGYIGDKDVSSVLMSGLWKLEYRGYDSSGIAVIDDGDLKVRKSFGKLMQLQELLQKEPVGGSLGIGHTRWATHGEPSDQNAHPQTDCNGKIAVVHNGIIENYYTLKEELTKKRHIFKSTTDTEVIAHLIEEEFRGDLKEAVLRAVEKLKGSFAIAVISEDQPDRIVAYRKGSPLIIGLGRNENLLASDIPAVIGHTKEVVILEDDEMAVLKKEGVEFYTKDGKRIEKQVQEVPWKPDDMNKGEFPHYMLKEIYEQPEVIRRNISLRIRNKKIDLGEEFNFTPDELARVNRIIIQACGTSWHAGYIGKYLLEDIARVHTEVDISSEFRYRNPVVNGETLVIAISQSGETADTLAGIREAKAKFLKVLSIVNVLGSTIARESDGVIYINAGPEIGVASTKAFTAQVFNVYMFTLYLARLKWTIQKEEMLKRLSELEGLPDAIERILKRDDVIRGIAERFKDKKHFIFLGRGINYPTALEGALKLKEISYIHATGYPAGELKHGPLALVDENMPVVAIATRSSVYEKMLNNLEEVKSRGGVVISVVTEGDERAKAVSDYTIEVPEAPEYLSPIVNVVPLQLLAYHIAALNGRDVDKPRNLAKSVTVE
ncbi:MAG TPA: glutamine--fructose-6-phosphate transaminase (isomerizing) [candidate division WOR-3 bacterium]|uniref:Glutamine--fructose-6-phosphate aminotransferase [isomerizing] n=1 Tax=candidate division WOR-3 bacterium TaxID=2052148 RepID=A0A7C0ZEY5_UNCW3|nr:glutamine--fructose-6-phosphate transaminase (isomerizing) [candidate division WOR-3 bacterium]